MGFDHLRRFPRKTKASCPSYWSEKDPEKHQVLPPPATLRAKRADPPTPNNPWCKEGTKVTLKSSVAWRLSIWLVYLNTIHHSLKEALVEKWETPSTTFGVKMGARVVSYRFQFQGEPPEKFRRSQLTFSTVCCKSSELGRAQVDSDRLEDSWRL